MRTITNLWLQLGAITLATASRFIGPESEIGLLPILFTIMGGPLLLVWHVWMAATAARTHDVLPRSSTFWSVSSAVALVAANVLLSDSNTKDHYPSVIEAVAGRRLDWGNTVGMWLLAVWVICLVGTLWTLPGAHPRRPPRLSDVSTLTDRK
jgi:hypothetical protein